MRKLVPKNLKNVYKEIWEQRIQREKALQKRASGLEYYLFNLPLIDLILSERFGERDPVKVDMINLKSNVFVSFFSYLVLTKMSFILKKRNVKTCNSNNFCITDFVRLFL